MQIWEEKVRHLLIGCSLRRIYDLLTLLDANFGHTFVAGEHDPVGESQQTFNHMNESFKEYPEVQSVEQATNQSFLIFDCIVVSFFNDVLNGVKLVCYLVFLQAEFASPLVVLLNVQSMCCQPLDQARFVNVAH